MNSNLGTQTLTHSFLENSAKIRPDKLAFIHDKVRLTYAQVNSMANRLALWLLDQGVGAGDRIVLILENSIEYVAGYYGALKAGGIAIPLNYDIRSYSLQNVLEELQPKVIISSGRFEQLLQHIKPEVFGVHMLLIKDRSPARQLFRCTVIEWDDVVHQGQDLDPGLSIEETALASIIYTSGSTGKPKGVMLSHRNIVSNTFSIVQYLNLVESDIQMVVLPFFYVMGKSLLNTHFAAGGTVVVNNRFAYPACVLQQMVKERVTGFSGVPSTYAYLLHRSPLLAYRDQLESLRYCTQAGGHMPSQLKEKLLEVLPSHTKLYIMYGATEAAARLSYEEPEQLRSKIDSIGRQIPGVTLNILDEKGTAVPCGQRGELVACGPNIMLGYWMDEAGTSSVLDENGYHTGDMGYEDEDGYFYVIGRKDDLLKVGGHRIYPQEIEDAMMGAGLLVEVAVFGVEDGLLGQRLVAIAVPSNGKTTERDILAHCFSRFPRHKVPSEIRLVDSLPKNLNGKINRAGCKELFMHQPSM